MNGRGFAFFLLFLVALVLLLSWLSAGLSLLR